MASSRTAATSGWALFAGVLLLIAGAFDLFMGIAALRNTHYFYQYTAQGLVVWDLNGFGWVHVALGSLMIITSFGLFAMMNWARIIALIFVICSAVLEVFWLTTTPFWSLAIIALDVMIIYGLTSGWRQWEES